MLDLGDFGEAGLDVEGLGDNVGGGLADDEVLTVGIGVTEAG
jgi:hypothetical protein